MPRFQTSCSVSSPSSTLPAPWARASQTSAASCSGASPCPAGRSLPADHRTHHRGYREERKASQAFLSTLNESLSSVHYSFTESLDEGRALQNAAHLSGQALERELAAIDRAMAAHDSPQILRGAISGHLDTIRRLQQEREEMANRERHLLTHLSNMEAKLRLMKDETAEYKKRLSIQKHKLFLDSLTQVHNRAALDERLELEYKRWLRYGTPVPGHHRHRPLQAHQ